MKKPIVINIFKVLIYIAATFLFLWVLTYTLTGIRDIGVRRISRLALLPELIFPFIISALFSYKHLLLIVRKNGKLKFSIPHFLTALILGVLLLALYLPITPILSVQIAFIWNAIFSRYGILAFSFMFWFHLIHSFTRESP